MIPFDISGTTRIATGHHASTATVNAVAERLKHLLEEYGVSDVVRESNRVRFRNDWFNYPNHLSWTVWDRICNVVIFECKSGTFVLETSPGEIVIRFQLSMLRLWAGCAAFLAIYYALHAPSSEPLWPPLAVAAGIWAISFALAGLRIRHWLKRELAEVDERSMRI